jgi:hypothetical protein
METNQEKKIADCHRLAREARSKAERATDFAVKRDFLHLERRWLLLAQSYEWVERRSDARDQSDNRIAIFMPPEPPDPSLPRVMCPACGKLMTLKSITPSVDGRTETSAFNCACGNTFTQIAPHADG